MNVIKLYHKGEEYFPYAIRLDEKGQMISFAIDGDTILSKNSEDKELRHYKVMMGSGVSDEFGNIICDGHVISMTERFDENFLIKRYAVVEYDAESGKFVLCLFYFDRIFDKTVDKFVWKCGGLLVEEFSYWRDFETGEGIEVVGNKYNDSLLLEKFELVFEPKEKL